MLFLTGNDVCLIVNYSLKKAFGLEPQAPWVSCVDHRNDTEDDKHVKPSCFVVRGNMPVQVLHGLVPKSRSAHMDCAYTKEKHTT